MIGSYASSAVTFPGVKVNSSGYISRSSNIGSFLYYILRVKRSDDMDQKCLIIDLKVKIEIYSKIVYFDL